MYVYNPHMGVPPPRAREAGGRKLRRFFYKMIQKKFSSSLSRQSSVTKQSTKLVLVSREPLLYLEFNKPNKQIASEINLFKKFNFSQSQNNC